MAFEPLSHLPRDVDTHDDTKEHEQDGAGNFPHCNGTFVRHPELGLPDAPKLFLPGDVDFLGEGNLSHGGPELRHGVVRDSQVFQKERDEFSFPFRQFRHGLVGLLQDAPELLGDLGVVHLLLQGGEVLLDAQGFPLLDVDLFPDLSGDGGGGIQRALKGFGGNLAPEQCVPAAPDALHGAHHLFHEGAVFQSLASELQLRLPLGNAEKHGAGFLIAGNPGHLPPGGGEGPLVLLALPQQSLGLLLEILHERLVLPDLSIPVLLVKRQMADDLLLNLGQLFFPVLENAVFDLEIFEAEAFQNAQGPEGVPFQYGVVLEPEVGGPPMLSVPHQTDLFFCGPAGVQEGIQGLLSQGDLGSPGFLLFGHFLEAVFVGIGEGEGVGRRGQ